MSHIVRNLLTNVPDIIEHVKELTHVNMKLCANKFIPHENTIKTSMELIRGLYDEDLTLELLIAPTQFGKTSTVFWTAYNLMMHIDPKYFVPFPFVFIMTGLNSNSWKEQTQERVLPCMQENVWHNKDMCKPENVQRLKDAVMSDYNTLIIIDEVHVGTKLDHVIFNTLREFHPDHEDHEVSQNELFDFLHEKHVKFLLVSATPDAIKETMEKHWDPKKYKTIIAYPDSAPTYVWHKDFLNMGRVHQAYNMKGRTENGVAFHKVIAKRISEYSRPLYHMIRFPMDTKTAEIEVSKQLLEESIRKLEVDIDIVMWDAKNTIQSYFNSNNYNVFADTTITKHHIQKMTNEEVLKEPPRRHTLFILKELFRVAQTMPIDNIGILVDRDTKTPCDSTLSQSLIGRACGHNKKQLIDQINIYTHVKSVINYINLWENGFDYSKVPGYSGNGIQTTKNGTKLKAAETMLGENVERNVQWTNTTKHDNMEDQEDTHERLEMVRKAYNKKHTIVHRIINMYIDNGFQPITEKQIQSASKSNVICMKHYIHWDTQQSRHKIIEKQKDNDMWVLRSVIKDYLSL